MHHEMPKYFSKPRFSNQSLPEVIKNKANMMSALRAIKTREEIRDSESKKSRFSQVAGSGKKYNKAALNNQLDRFL